MASLRSQRTIFLLCHALSRPRPGSWCYCSSPSCAIGRPLLAERRQPGANFPCRLAVSTAVDWPCGAASCPNTSCSRPQALLGKAAIAAQGFRIDPILATPLRVSEPHVSNSENPDPNGAGNTSKQPPWRKLGFDASERVEGVSEGLALLRLREFLSASPAAACLLRAIGLAQGMDDKCATPALTVPGLTYTLLSALVMPVFSSPVRPIPTSFRPLSITGGPFPILRRPVEKKSLKIAVCSASLWVGIPTTSRCTKPNQYR